MRVMLLMAAVVVRNGSLGAFVCTQATLLAESATLAVLPNASQF